MRERGDYGLRGAGVGARTHLSPLHQPQFLHCLVYPLRYTNLVYPLRYTNLVYPLRYTNLVYPLRYTQPNSTSCTSHSSVLQCLIN